MKSLLLLIKKLDKFFRLSLEKKILLIKVFLLMGIVRFAILFVPFKKLAGFTGICKEESSRQISDTEKVSINKIGWAVAVASRYTPWESKCFVQALTGQIMLRKRKISSTLYLGVAKNEEKKPMAHAWLRSGTTIVTGGYAYNSFTQVAKFANNVRGRK